MNKLVKLMNRLEDILWPRGMQCLCCDELSGGEWLCPTCQKALAVMRLAPGDEENECVRSVYWYEGAAKTLVKRLKDQGNADAACVLADGMTDTLRTMALPPDAVLTWVTMPARRRRERWIDHGRTLCEEVARRTGWPARQLLERRGNLHTQRGLNRSERLRNLSGSIVCPERVTMPVILVDDVLTTGATVAACAEALRAAGAPQVYAVTATRTAFIQQENAKKG